MDALDGEIAKCTAVVSGPIRDPAHRLRDLLTRTRWIPLGKSMEG